MSLSRGVVTSLSTDAGKVLGYRQEAQTKSSPSLWIPAQSQTPDCYSHQPVIAYPRLASQSSVADGSAGFQALQVLYADQVRILWQTTHQHHGQCPYAEQA